MVLLSQTLDFGTADDTLHHNKEQQYADLTANPSHLQCRLDPEFISLPNLYVSHWACEVITKQTAVIASLGILRGNFARR
jgi:hypothetical protein